MALTAADRKAIVTDLLATKLSNGYTVAQNIVNATSKTDEIDSIVKAIKSSGISTVALAAELKK